MKPRVLLADDHMLLLEAFEMLLAPHCQVVGKAIDGRALVDMAEALRPDVIVLDMAMPVMNGLEAGREIKERFPLIKLIFLTINDDPDLVAEAFHAGASGYLLKRSAASELRDAIDEVMQGRSYITRLLADHLVSSLLTTREPGRHHQLTDRQRQVLYLIARGHSMKQIGAELHLAPRTIAFHKYRMMEQLGVKSTAELVVVAAKRLMIS